MLVISTVVLFYEMQKHVKKLCKSKIQQVEIANGGMIVDSVCFEKVAKKLGLQNVEIIYLLGIKRPINFYDSKC